MTEKLQEYFEEMIVYKDLKSNNFFSSLGLPAFLRDYLLKTFSDDYGNFNMEEVSDFVKKFIPKKEDWMSIKNKIIYENENVQLLTKISVDINIKTGEISFALPDFGVTEKETMIESSIWELYKDDLISSGEIWGIIKLGYRPPDETVKPKSPGKNNDKKQIYTVLAEMQKIGIYPYFYLFVSADDMNSTMNIVQTYQGGLGMGERDFYIEDEESIKTIRSKYKEHVKKMFLLAEFSEDSANKSAEAVMDIETQLAQASRSRVSLRDPHANYNKFSLEVLKEDFSTFEWDDFLKGVGLSSTQEIIVGQPETLKKAFQLMDEKPLEDQIAYLQWNLINSAASYLSDDFVNQNFDFYGKTMSGTQELQPRWKRAVSSVNGALGEAVGQMYVEKHFPQAAKNRMLELVGNLQTALGERIQELEWMSEVTKEKALEKLATFHVKIGYPDKWKDYSSLAIKNDNYWENIKRANQWEHAEMIAKADNPVDPDEWFMNPQTVNAYYNPTTNEICFPAGILQYPFFDMNADDAFNYGAIGVVIGHEMTHGFDDQGRQYDKEGNLKDWWTEEDAVNFTKRAQVMIDFFNAIEVAPGVHANGEFTLGENIADHGGLQVSYQALKNATKDNPLKDKDGFTPEQRFFLAYGNVWAGNIRSEEILRLTKIDPHSLGQWRVDGALPHIDAWYKAFNITEKDPMFIAPKDRVSIW